MRNALFALAMVAGTTSFAQASEITLSSGGPTGNYFKMANDIVSYCAKPVSKHGSLVAVNSEGSVDNLMGMLHKKYRAGIVQEDVLYFYANTMPNQVSDNHVKVISELHQEAVHLLIPRDYKPKSQDGGFWSLFSKKREPSPVISLDMLKGQQVGSWGGSMVSAQALNHFFDLSIELVELKVDKRLDPQMPVIIVGGHPFQPVQDLINTSKYRLVSIDYEALGKDPRTSFYSDASVTYLMSGSPVSVSTIGVRALLLGANFRNPDKNVAMSKLASCVSKNMMDLSDDAETSPAWRSALDLIEAEKRTGWEYFPLAKK
ncbi:hypothetical protein [Thaumasiovibrio subtropicus]|uniref:hypothetical protein n=1 Tax=Thaumasiovibrio subtropicus TaxID=1891207 RepID=UPI000B354E4D|nr:hypothetical protein [Thaumasiovibrio subtropicus]